MPKVVTSVLIILVIALAGISGFFALNPRIEQRVETRVATLTTTAATTVTTTATARVTTTATATVTNTVTAPERVPLPADYRDYLKQRETQLYEAAKKEGSVGFYTTESAGFLERIKKAFESKYPGVTIAGIRGSGSEILQRVLSETRAGTRIVDVIHALNPVAFSQLSREKILRAYDSSESEAYSPQLKLGELLITHYSPQSIVYNTDLVRGQDIPTDYWDVLKPRFKGKIGLLDPAVRPFVLLDMKEVVGKERWPEFVRGLCTQKAQVIRQVGPIANAIKTGEIELGLWVFVGTPTIEMKKGAPMDYVRRKTVTSVGYGIALSNHAPHLNAAMLFYDWMISHAGGVELTNAGIVPTRPGVPQLAGKDVGVGIPLDPADIKSGSAYDTQSAEDDALKQWNELFKC